MRMLSTTPGKGCINRSVAAQERAGRVRGPDVPVLVDLDIVNLFLQLHDLLIVPDQRIVPLLYLDGLVRKGLSLLRDL